MSRLRSVSSDPLQKDEINKKAFEKFKKEHSSVAPSIDNAAPSERFDCEDIFTAESLIKDSGFIKTNSHTFS